MTEYEDQKRDLEDDLEKLTEAAEDAEARLSSIYGWEIPDLWDEDDLDLGQARGYIQTAQEAANEVASILADARDRVRDRLDNLHVEDDCDECGQVIVNDDHSEHLDECSQKEG